MPTTQRRISITIATAALAALPAFTGSTLSGSAPKVEAYKVYCVQVLPGQAPLPEVCVVNPVG